MTALPRLYLNHDPDLDWLMAYEFGRVDDGQPPLNWRGVSAELGYLHDEPGGRCIGFRVQDLSVFDTDDEAVAEIWDGPRFDVPQLGLSAASAGEIVLAARPFFDGEPSLNRVLFAAATEVTGERAVTAWRRVLEAGDAMAHFGLGYTLLDLGRHAEAYRHLRHYTEIAPAGAWNWCYYAQAAEALGELGEARAAYQRTIELAAVIDQWEPAADLAGERLAALPG